MEIQFTPEQEAQLAVIAHREGLAPARLVQQAALRLLGEDSIEDAEDVRDIDARIAEIRSSAPTMTLDEVERSLGLGN